MVPPIVFRYIFYKIYLERIEVKVGVVAIRALPCVASRHGRIRDPCSPLAARILVFAGAGPRMARGGNAERRHGAYPACFADATSDLSIGAVSWNRV